MNPDTVITKIENVEIQGATNVARAGVELLQSMDAEGADDERIATVADRLNAARPTEPMLHNAIEGGSDVGGTTLRNNWVWDATGTYDVELMLSNSDGSDSITKSIDVTGGSGTTEVIATDFDESPSADAYDVSGGTITLDSGATSGADTFRWQSMIPLGAKTIRTTFNVQERGHLAFQARDNTGNIVSYVNLDRNGGENVYINPDTDIGADYETGRDYVLELRQEDGSNLRWTLRQSGNVIMSEAVSATDFAQFSISSWDGEKEVQTAIKQVALISSAQAGR